MNPKPRPESDPDGHHGRFNMLNADSPAGVFNAAAEGAIDYMGGAVFGALFGPPGAIAGSQTSKIAKDPVGSVKSVVHCVFGGYCGDAPVRDVGCIPNGGKRGCRLCFRRNCGETAGGNFRGPAQTSTHPGVPGANDDGAQAMTGTAPPKPTPEPPRGLLL